MLVVMGAVVPVSARFGRSPLVAVSEEVPQICRGGNSRDLQRGALREQDGLGGCVAEGDAADKIINSYQMICEQK
jgi:hypothetical protein